jgi:hypothetical protein
VAHQLPPHRLQIATRNPDVQAPGARAPPRFPASSTCEPPSCPKNSIVFAAACTSTVLQQHHHQQAIGSRNASTATRTRPRRLVPVLALHVVLQILIFLSPSASTTSSSTYLSDLLPALLPSSRSYCASIVQLLIHVLPSQPQPCARGSKSTELSSSFLPADDLSRLCSALNPRSPCGRP